MLLSPSPNKPSYVLGVLGVRAPWGLLAVLASVLLIWLGLDAYSLQVRLTLVVFALAIGGWVFTRVNDTYIALVAAVSLVLLGLEEPEGFFASLGDSMIWLLLAAFFVATAVRQSGLAQRLSFAVAARARSVQGLFYALSGVIVVTAFVIPSTSGRAALLLPVFTAFAELLPPRVVRALALLFPTIILLSAVASLIGAGAHLITAEMLSRMGGERLDYFRWMLLGTPLALVSSLLSTWVILHLFLTRQERQQSLEASPPLQATPSRLSPAERYVLMVGVALVVLWMTEPLHQLNSTLVALLGAMAVTLPRLGNISFREGLKGVEWNILLFMAATLELGEALVRSGAAQVLVEEVFRHAQRGFWGNSWALVLLVILLSLLSHLVIVSRSARSTVLVPLVVVLADGAGHNSTALAFISTAAAGYCLSLMVSAKPLGLYGQIERPTFTQADLFRLSGVLLPLHGGIFALFAFLIWPAMGLPLANQPRQTIATPPAPPVQALHSRPGGTVASPSENPPQLEPIQVQIAPPVLPAVLPTSSAQPRSVGAAPARPGSPPRKATAPSKVPGPNPRQAQPSAKLDEETLRRQRKQELIEANLRRQQERLRFHLPAPTLLQKPTLPDEED
ncbi:SLC13 family permease [Meiothermus rufus]|uniref:SLC13 family permease n=1 Tax=Meiothermus rufus TaxID=604332 RepID=UPI0006872A81|nr:SLC13 family permease [Meiothermus rufus]